MPITDEDEQRRHRFATYLEKAMRTAGYVRSSGDLDVPALSRMSGVADNILRRWLSEAGDPSLPNLRLLAPALGLEPIELFVASGLVLPEEASRTGASEPPRPPTPEERIMADDLLSDEDKSALIHTLRGLRERRSSPDEPKRRRQA